MIKDLKALSKEVSVPTAVLLIVFCFLNILYTVVNFYYPTVEFKVLITVLFIVTAVLFILIAVKKIKTETNKRTEAKFAQIFDFLEDEVAIINAQNLTLSCVNKSLLNNLQYEKNELTGKSINAIYSKYKLEQVQDFIKPLITKEVDSLICEVTVERKDGSKYPAAINLHYFNDTNTLVAINQEPTKETEPEDPSNQIISITHHELKTPLTAISGALKIISSGMVGEVPKSMVEMLRLASNNSAKLLKRIDEPLWVKKLQE